MLSKEENRRFFNDREKLMNHVVGRIAYLKMVKGKDAPVAQHLEEAIKSIPQKPLGDSNRIALLKQYVVVTFREQK